MQRVVHLIEARSSVDFAMRSDDGQRKPHSSRAVRRLEDLVGVPFEELAVRPASGKSDRLTGSGIELLVVTEVRTESRADHEPMVQIDAQVSMVEHGVHV